MNREEEWLSETDLHLLAEGVHYRSFEKLGAHVTPEGTWFSVWAPNARFVSVVGDFNSWDERACPLRLRGSYWEGLVPQVSAGARYKYFIISQYEDYRVLKSDPFAVHSEVPPLSASIVSDISTYQWGDEAWLARRSSLNQLYEPLTFYEVHLGSWRRKAEELDRTLTYRELAELLAPYVSDMGFTHVELLPLAEYPSDSSWGYQTLGFFAPTSRYGTPLDLMYFVDVMHQHGIGVVMDWCPAHFSADSGGLGFFDGTCLYEHADPRQGFYGELGTFEFNYGRREVASFLIANALFWLEKYHLDGLRINSVPAMLFLDYGRKAGEWVANQYGGREHLDGIQFLRRLNEVVYGKFPDIMMIAEEPSTWPMVSRPTYAGGLGFGLKWNLGWMQDAVAYIGKDPLHRSYHHNSLTHNLSYAFLENFVLPLPHDEVVHHKGSFVTKMPGDVWQKFANLRVLLGFMYGMSGKKLMFMGTEFGQWREWDFQTGLDWNLLEYPLHRGLQLWVKDLNYLVRNESALHDFDVEPHGFAWIDYQDNLQSVLSFVRRGRNPDEEVLCVFNFTPIPRYNYRLGIDRGGYWEELLNSDSRVYGGSDLGNSGGVFTDEVPFHGQSLSVNLTLPPLGAIFFRALKRA